SASVASPVRALPLVPVAVGVHHDAPAVIVIVAELSLVPCAVDERDDAPPAPLAAAVFALVPLHFSFTVLLPAPLANSATCGEAVQAARPAPSNRLCMLRSDVPDPATATHVDRPTGATGRGDLDSGRRCRSCLARGDTNG